VKRSTTGRADCRTAGAITYDVENSTIVLSTEELR